MCVSLWRWRQGGWMHLLSPLIPLGPYGPGTETPLGTFSCCLRVDSENPIPAFSAIFFRYCTSCERANTDFTKGKRQQDNVRLPNRRGGCRGLCIVSGHMRSLHGLCLVARHKKHGKTCLHKPCTQSSSTTNDSGLHFGISEGSIYWNVAT